MNLTSPSTYSAAARSIMELRNLRRVKLFPRVSAVTVVTYYRKHDAVDDYAGRAYILNWHKGEVATVETIHNSHAPPKDDEEVAKEEDVTEPIGFTLLPT